MQGPDELASHKQSKEVQYITSCEKSGKLFYLTRLALCLCSAAISSIILMLGWLHPPACRTTKDRAVLRSSGAFHSPACDLLHLSPACCPVAANIAAAPQPAALPVQDVLACRKHRLLIPDHLSILICATSLFTIMVQLLLSLLSTSQHAPVCCRQP